VKRHVVAPAIDNNGDAESMRSAWDGWQADSRAFWQQMDALVEILNGPITEGIESV
jgi:type I restriction enzyme M protein